jgi:GNAT superfamily N-acetyltransferase
MDIGPAQPDEWPAAFNLALQYVPDDERPTRVANALTLLHAGEIDPAGIFVARTADGLVGVQVCIPLRGSSGLFWLPQVDPAWRNQPISDRLVQAAIPWVRQRGAKLAQALLHPSDLPHAGALTRGGFRHITDLQYLSHDLQDLPSVLAVDGLQFESFSAAIEPVFQQTLLRTYDNTLDCPELNGVRSIEEILDGHRAQGIWHPQAWWLAKVGETPAGVVMLTELPDGDGWDLSYVGLAPEFRRRGLGKALAVHAVAAAAQWHAAQLMLAVDQRNAPAQRLYESLGFQATGCRSVLLQVF